VGAIYLDLGREKVLQFLKNNILPVLDKHSEEKKVTWKMGRQMNH